VSLRDVDRTLQVMMWFFEHDELFELMDRKAAAEAESEVNPETDDVELEEQHEVVPFFVS